MADDIPLAGVPWARGQPIPLASLYDQLAASAGIAPPGTPTIDQINWGQPSWLQQAAEQSQRDRAAFVSGGVPGMMRNTEGTQDLAGGFGGGMLGTTKAAATVAAEEALPPLAKMIRAFHGSPHDFERFDMSKIGTGEGAQVYGHGLYFAEHEPVARQYRDAISLRNMDEWPKADKTTLAAEAHRNEASYQELLDAGGTEFEYDRRPFIRMPDSSVVEFGPEGIHRTIQPPGGKMYEVNINADPEHFLDWDKPLSEQHPKVREAIAEHDRKAIEGFNPENVPGWGVGKPATVGHGDPTGSKIVDRLSGLPDKDAGIFGGRVSQERATETLREAGIPGIKYLDQGSRAPRFDRDLDIKPYGGGFTPVGKHGNFPIFDTVDEAMAALEKEKGGRTHNYVVFDDKLIDIIKKYGWAGVAAGLGLSQTPQQSSVPLATTPRKMTQ